MPQLFECIAGVGNQLTDEDLLIRVEGMNNDIQQLADLCLECVFFYV